MTAQHDMFAGSTSLPDPASDESVPPEGAGDGDTVGLLPLAIPCGFRNRGNAPCRRLADAPVMLDGRPFVHRGYQLMHCRRPCWLDDETAADYTAHVKPERGSIGEPDHRGEPPVPDDPGTGHDPDDPGYTEMPDHADHDGGFSF